MELSVESSNGTPRVVTDPLHSGNLGASSTRHFLFEEWEPCVFVPLKQDASLARNVLLGEEVGPGLAFEQWPLAPAVPQRLKSGLGE